MIVLLDFLRYALRSIGWDADVGLGIIVVRDLHGRVFKVEVTQVDGPE